MGIAASTARCSSIRVGLKAVGVQASGSASVLCKTVNVDVYCGKTQDVNVSSYTCFCRKVHVSISFYSSRKYRPRILVFVVNVMFVLGAPTCSFLCTRADQDSGEVSLGLWQL